MADYWIDVCRNLIASTQSEAEPGAVCVLCGHPTGSHCLATDSGPMCIHHDDPDVIRAAATFHQWPTGEGVVFLAGVPLAAVHWRKSTGTGVLLVGDQRADVKDSTLDMLLDLLGYEQTHPASPTERTAS